MNLVLTLLSSHLLSVIENALIADEPEIVAAVEQEIELLIIKLESFLQKTHPALAAVATPVLNNVNSVADASLDAAGKAAVAASGN